MREKTGWLTCVHARVIILKNVSFLVYQKSRLRVLATGKKTVHAFAVGECVGYNGNITRELGQQLLVLPLETNTVTARKIGYNPKEEDFYFHQGEAVKSVERLIMQPDGLYEVIGS
jgi:hypothetical protein